METFWKRLQTFYKYIFWILMLVFVVSMMGVTIWLWRFQFSYVHPGPAVAMLFLTMVVVLTAAAFFLLYREHQSLLDTTRNNQVESVNLPVRPRIMGLEFLIERWHKFHPRREDSLILHEQIAIMIALVQEAYCHVSTFHVLDYFSGFKIKGGAFLVQAGEQRPFVLKFDSEQNINAEQTRYADCVGQQLGLTPGEPRVPAQTFGRLDGRAWGAVVYNLVGANQADLARLNTFATYYAACQTTDDIEYALNEVFDSLRPWWRETTWPPACDEYRQASLYREYDRLVRKQMAVRESMAAVGEALDLTQIATITANESYIHMLDEVKLRNPLNWVRDTFAKHQVGRWIDEASLRRDSIVHGDCHAGNLLISQGDHNQIRAWVIDFPHTHVGPTVQDLARLEAEILFGLTNPDEIVLKPGAHCVESWLQLAGILFPAPEHDPPTFEALKPRPRPLDLAPNLALEKGHTAVNLIRREALRYLVGYDARPYYLALLHAILPITYYGNFSPHQKLAAFLTAALLCERL